MITEKDIQRLQNGIDRYPDFPKKGILFEDLSPLYRDRELFKIFVEAYAEASRKFLPIDYIAGIEARGFIMGAALARRLDCGFIPVRKKGKLPGELLTEEYSLEYGTDSLQIQRDERIAGKRVLIIDDVYATGGTIKAVIRLFSRLTDKIFVGIAKDIKIADIAEISKEYFVLFD